LLKNIYSVHNRNSGRNAPEHGGMLVEFMNYTAELDNLRRVPTIVITFKGIKGPLPL
jgi:hypothetical protein